MAARYGADLRPVVVRTALVNPPELKAQELTQRCRSFLFAATAGAVACAEHAESIEVYESGVGAINLPLMHGMATGAYTTKSSHPRFMRVMGELVSQVAGHSVAFELPHRGRTKAQLVRTLAEDELTDLARSTVSCIHFPGRGRDKQCGYCCACIGRRQAMIEAGISEPMGTYEIDLFGGAVSDFGSTRLDYLKAMLLQVDRLAELSRRDMPEWFLRYALGTGVCESVAELPAWIGVLTRYREEWLRITAAGKSKGWNWATWLPSPCAA